MTPLIQNCFLLDCRDYTLECRRVTSCLIELDLTCCSAAVVSLTYEVTEPGLFLTAANPWAIDLLLWVAISISWICHFMRCFLVIFLVIGPPFFWICATISGVVMSGLSTSVSSPPGLTLDIVGIASSLGENHCFVYMGVTVSRYAWFPGVNSPSVFTLPLILSLLLGSIRTGACPCWT